MVVRLCRKPLESTTFFGLRRAPDIALARE